jgi:hypothetical protein
MGDQAPRIEHPLVPTKPSWQGYCRYIFVNIKVFAISYISSMIYE